MSDEKANFSIAAKLRRGGSSNWTELELSHLVSLLNSNTLTGKDLLNALGVLRTSEAYAAAPAIAGVLESTEDWQVAFAALSTLSFWGLMEEAIGPAINRFLGGVPWDDELQLRELAISCATPLIASERWPGITRIVISYALGSIDLSSAFKDRPYELTSEDLLRETAGIRRTAFEALAIGMGMTWSETLGKGKAKAEWKRKVRNHYGLPR